MWRSITDRRSKKMSKLAGIDRHAHLIYSIRYAYTHTYICNIRRTRCVIILTACWGTYRATIFGGRSWGIEYIAAPSHFQVVGLADLLVDSLPLVLWLFAELLLLVLEFAWCCSYTCLFKPIGPLIDTLLSTVVEWNTLLFNMLFFDAIRNGTCFLLRAYCSSITFWEKFSIFELLSSSNKCEWFSSPLLGNSFAFSCSVNFVGSIDFPLKPVVGDVDQNWILCFLSMLSPFPSRKWSASFIGLTLNPTWGWKWHTQELK